MRHGPQPRREGRPGARRRARWPAHERHLQRLADQGHQRQIQPLATAQWHVADVRLRLHLADDARQAHDEEAHAEEHDMAIAVQ